MALAPLLSRYDNVLLDLDGCVWVGTALTRGAGEALAELRSAGKAIGFLTNDSRHSPEEYVRKLWSLGLRASLEEVVTVGSALQFALAGNERRGVFVIGSEAIFRHVAEAGHTILNGTPRASSAELVVICGHDEFDFRELTLATQAMLGGAEALASDRDETFPTEDGLWPGTGAIVAALEYATGRTARVLGKPDPEIFRAALDRFASGRTLMVGDRLDSDLEGAHAAGIDAAIVLTGVCTRAEAEAAHEPAPVAIAEDLSALLVAA